MSARFASQAIVSALSSSKHQLRSFHSTLRRNEIYQNVDPEAFKKAMANKDKVVLVDFYADWCKPCKAISPILEEIAKNSNFKTGSGDAVDLVTVDTDREVSLCAEHDIRALPTVMAFRDGKLVQKFVGAFSKAQIHGFLRSI